MNKPTGSRDVSKLIALITAMIEYWKEISTKKLRKRSRRQIQK